MLELSSQDLVPKKPGNTSCVSMQLAPNRNLAMADLFSHRAMAAKLR